MNSSVQIDERSEISGVFEVGYIPVFSDLRAVTDSVQAL
jgi:hypothetical protein